MSTAPAPAPAAPGRGPASVAAGGPVAGGLPAAAPLPAGVAGMPLGSRLAPPFALPGRHFAVALGFLILGSAGLIWTAPLLARGAFAAPQVAAVAHLLALGWITTTILGALYQFLPVALVEPIRSQTAARLGLWLYAPGLALFTFGLAFGVTVVVAPGAVLFGVALLLFIGNLSLTLLRARRGSRGTSVDSRLTWWALAGAAVFLSATLALGLGLAANLGSGFLGANRFAVMAAHLHIAVGGWVMLTVVGVAHRLLPMFLLSHGASARPAVLSITLLAIGCGLLLARHHSLTPAVAWAAAALLAVGLIAFVVQVALFFRHRRKPVLDPGLRLAAGGIALLGAALLLAPGFVHYGIGAPRLATAYVLLLLGGLSCFVAGHYYKILPFLVWFHRYGPLVGTRPLPRVADLYDARAAAVAAALLAGGIAGLSGAALLGLERLATAFALLFGAGATVLTVQMFNVSRRRPE